MGREIVVLGVRPHAHTFGYGFVAWGPKGTRLLDAGVIRARASYGGSDIAASYVRQGRELAGLLRVVASRERVAAIAAPAVVVEKRPRATELAELARGWGQVDLLGEALGVPVVCVPPVDIDQARALLEEKHSGPWLEELTGERLSGLAAHAWMAVGAAELACTTGRVSKALAPSEARSA